MKIASLLGLRLKAQAGVAVIITIQTQRFRSILIERKLYIFPHKNPLRKSQRAVN